MALHCERCGQENAKDARFCRHCGAQIASLETDPALVTDPLIGQMVLGRYEVTSLIGEGGMGRVYAAAQRVGTTTRKVAVKTLLAQLGADPQLVKRFYREAETIVRLTHPNTIQFFDFGELPDRTLVIVMEFIEGRSLADALLEGPLAPARFDAILTQICGALFEAHQLGIVHRDLKPDNILLTERGGRTDFVKVLDFGIAKISNLEEDKPQATKLTQQGMMVGTPPYMSPEQFSGEQVDARSDIYSLGVIAYEMLTGRLPFAAKTPWEWASKHMTAEPEPLRVDAQTGVSERRAWAIGRALSKSPADRQRDVQEFLADLTGTGTFTSEAKPTPTASLPATAAAPTPINTSRTDPGTGDVVHLPSRKGPWLWVAALMAALLVASGGLWWAGRGATTPAPPPVTALAVPASPSVAPLPESPVAAAPTAQGAVLPAAPTSMATAERPDSEAPRSPERPHTERRVRSDRTRAPDEDKTPSPQPATPQPVAAPSPTTTPTPTPTALVAPAPVQTSTPSAQVPKDLADRVKRGLAAAGENKPEIAIGIYQAAASKYGADHPALLPLKRSLTSRGPAKIRELVAAGRCAQAQALFRAMRSAGLAPAPGALFGRSCPAPN